MCAEPVCAQDSSQELVLPLPTVGQVSDEASIVSVS